MDDVSAFAYDWRRDNNESADCFIAYLEQIKQRHGGRAAQVVAHSNGGKRIDKDNQDWFGQLRNVSRFDRSFKLRGIKRAARPIPFGSFLWSSLWSRLLLC